MKNLVLLVAFISLLTALAPARVRAQAVTDEQLGLMYYNNREFDKAASLFERLFEEKPTLFNYTYLLASLLEINDYDRAEKIVKRQARKNPNDARYVIDQGYILLRTNQGNKAQKIFEQAIKDLPADQRKISELASAFIARRENNYAIQTYQKGKQLLSGQYNFGFELANLYEISGSYEKMADEFIGLIEFNSDYLNQVQSRLQNTFNNDPEGLKSEAFRIALLKKVQRNPDDMLMAEMMLWLSTQLKDFEAALIQAKALDRRMSENGSRVFALAGMSAANGHYKTAAEAYQYVIDRSSDVSLVVQSKVEILKAEYEQIIRTHPVNRTDLIALEGKYNKTLQEAGNNPLAFPLMRNLAHLQAFYLDKTGEAINMLENLIAITGNNRMLQAECKLELADIMLFTGEPWEATLLYSQVEKAFKNEPIGHEARFRNARLSFYIGEFNWARAQLDVLKAATSKLIANDAMALSLLITDNIGMDSSFVPLGTYARADLMLYRNKPDDALALLDSLLLAFPGHPIVDDALMKQAEINIRQGKIQEAIAIYRKVSEEYGDGILGDDALFNLALIFDHNQPAMPDETYDRSMLFFLNIQEPSAKDREKAMTAYQDILMKYPGSLYTVEARKRFRALRGDEIIQ
ncbi:MAG TPA: tetratricopeptide repeat protein [Lentimicrobium sp.]|nr:tetratricopeptide repeat protein [Lentimicrobium sp.]